MQSNRRLVAVASIVASGGVFACVGGGGSIGDGMTMWEPAPSSLERAESSRESAPPFREDPASSREGIGPSADPGPGAQGGGPSAFQCAGTFSCVEDGEDDSTQVTLTSANGACSISSEGVTLVLDSDGSIVVAGQSIGTWHATANGFTVVIGDESVTCTRGGSGAAQGGGRVERPPMEAPGDGNEDDVPVPTIPPADDDGG